MHLNTMRAPANHPREPQENDTDAKVTQSETLRKNHNHAAALCAGKVKRPQIELSASNSPEKGGGSSEARRWWVATGTLRGRPHKK